MSFNRVEEGGPEYHLEGSIFLIYASTIRAHIDKLNEPCILCIFYSVKLQRSRFEHIDPVLFGMRDWARSTVG